MTIPLFVVAKMFPQFAADLLLILASILQLLLYFDFLCVLNIE